MKKELTDIEKDRIIEMAWEDRTTFDAILLQFGLKEQEVIDLMRAEMKPSSFRMWRARVQGRKTKHQNILFFVLIREWLVCSRMLMSIGDFQMKVK